MKSVLISLLVAIGIFVNSPITFADISRIDGGILYGGLRVNGGPQGYSHNEPLIYIPVEGEIHWAGLRWGLETGYGKSGQFDVFQASPRLGLEYDILDYKFKIAERYQFFQVTDNTTGPITHTFYGLALEIGGEWKISEMLKFYGVTVITDTGFYSRNGNLISGGDMGQQYLKIGAQITQLPLYHINLEYYKTGWNYAGENLNIYGEGFLIGVMIIF